MAEGPFENEVDERVNYHLNQTYQKIQLQKLKTRTIATPQDHGLNGAKETNDWQLKSDSLGVVEKNQKKKENRRYYREVNSETIHEVIDEDLFDKEQTHLLEQARQEEFIKQLQENARKQGYKLKMKGFKIIGAEPIRQ